MINPSDLLDQTTVESQGNTDDGPTDQPFVPQFPEILDSSMMAAFKSCPELFRKTYIEHFKPKGLSVHLHAGAAFAHGLEKARRSFFEQGLSAEDSVALGLQALLAFYGDYQCPVDSAKSAERMAGAFEFYFANYPLCWDDSVPIELPGNRRAIEFSFAHPLPILHPVTGNPLLYVGRMDAIISYAGGVYICDEKTTTQLGASWPRQWDLRGQFTGYAWGCKQSGISVEGAIVRGVSILKTKYDTAQSINYRPEWQIDRWYQELLEWVEDIKVNWAKTYQAGLHTKAWRHNLDHSCAEYGGCAFREACMSSDETPWLETAFERRVWNPLLRTEKKL